MSLNLHAVSYTHLDVYKRQVQASRVERAVLGIRSRIGKGTTIVNSYIMGSDHYKTLAEINEQTNAGQPLIGIGDRCYINNAIVDQNFRIGNDVSINGGLHLAEGDYGFYVVKEGIVVVKKGCMIPNGCLLYTSRCV